MSDDRLLEKDLILGLRALIVSSSLGFVAPSPWASANHFTNSISEKIRLIFLRRVEGGHWTEGDILFGTTERATPCTLERGRYFREFKDQFDCRLRREIRFSLPSPAFVRRLSVIASARSVRSCTKLS